VSLLLRRFYPKKNSASEFILIYSHFYFIKICKNTKPSTLHRELLPYSIFNLTHFIILSFFCCSSRFSKYTHFSCNEARSFVSSDTISSFLETAIFTLQIEIVINIISNTTHCSAYVLFVIINFINKFLFWEHFQRVFSAIFLNNTKNRSS